MDLVCLRTRKQYSVNKISLTTFLIMAMATRLPALTRPYWQPTV
jgi:hypothetical protein